jgi:hypothetical protein
MDKKIASLLGAAAALTTMTGAQATPAESPGPTVATSYRDLLDPIPNAVPLLKSDDARLTSERTNGTTRLAQISVQVGHHHHHHHHHGVRIRVGHHHHHHSRHHHHHHHDRD